MASSNTQPHAAYYWYYLHEEIRNVILAQLAEVEHNDGRPLSGYARVARDWQPAFERLAFSRLRVRPSELHDFQGIFQVTRRRGYLQYLGLVLELPKHSLVPRRVFSGTEEEMAMAQMLCIRRRGADAHSIFPELVSQEKENNIFFTKAVCDLFRSLGTWTQLEASRHGLSLEIIAESESYWRDIARRIRIRAGPMVVAVYNEEQPPGRDKPRHKTVQVDPAIWERCIRAGELDFHFSLDFNFTNSLIPCAAAIPKVYIITALSIQRKTIRHFDPRAVNGIIQRLPSLATFCWEFWPRAHWPTKHWFDDGLGGVIPSWPSSLKKVRICQQGRFYPTNHLGYNSSTRHNPYLGPLASKLAYLSKQLTHLSVEYTIDTQEIFTTVPRRCPILQKLILSSNQMILDDLPYTTHHQLRMAANMLPHMPELRFFVLYSVCDSGVACFSYQILHGVAVLGVRCSRPFKLDSDCSGAWQAVARDHCKGGGVRWCVETLPVDAVRFCLAHLLKANISTNCEGEDR